MIDIFTGNATTSDWLELVGALIAAVLAWLHGRKTAAKNGG